MSNNDNEDLKTLWICNECGIVLFFNEDGEDHCQQTGHKHLRAYDFETGNDVGK